MNENLNICHSIRRTCLLNASSKKSTYLDWPMTHNPWPELLMSKFRPWDTGNHKNKNSETKNTGHVRTQRGLPCLVECARLNQSLLFFIRCFSLTSPTTSTVNQNLEFATSRDAKLLFTSGATVALARKLQCLGRYSCFMLEFKASE